MTEERLKDLVYNVYEPDTNGAEEILTAFRDLTKELDELREYLSTPTRWMVGEEVELHVPPIGDSTLVGYVRSLPLPEKKS